MTGIECTNIDEYEEYYSARPDRRISNILNWWCSQAGTYPQLSRMAGDLLSIPAMSAECERVFSSTKLLISDRRNWLSEEVIEASECLKSWEMSGHMSW
jgi:hypothetical protein